MPDSSFSAPICKALLFDSVHQIPVSFQFLSVFYREREREKMSSSESEASNEDDLDDEDDDSDDDRIDSIHYQDDYDDYDFGDDDQISALIHSLLGEVPVAALQTRSMDTTNDCRIRPSMGDVGLTHTMASPPLSVYGDFIVSYLTAPPFDQRTATSTAPFYLSSGLIEKAAASNTGSSSKLFVGNIPLSVTLEQLRSFFDDRGYTVKDLQLPPSRVCTDLDWHPSFLCWCSLLIVCRGDQSMRLSTLPRTSSLNRHSLLRWMTQAHSFLTTTNCG